MHVGASLDISDQQADGLTIFEYYGPLSELSESNFVEDRDRLSGDDSDVAFGRRNEHGFPCFDGAQNCCHLIGLIEQDRILFAQRDSPNRLITSS